MGQDQRASQSSKLPFSRKLILAMGLALLLTTASFVVLALLPASKEPFFEAPLKSALTGLGVLGISCPLCLLGALLRQRSASSPYFEEAFIASVISLFGLVCLLVGLLCVGLSLYAVAARFLAS